MTTTTPTVTRDVEQYQQYLTAPSMDVPKWEYAVLRYEWAVNKLDTIQHDINEMGACGWALADERKLVNSVQTYPAPNIHLTLIFKRRTA